MNNERNLYSTVREDHTDTDGGVNHSFLHLNFDTQFFFVIDLDRGLIDLPSDMNASLCLHATLSALLVLRIVHKIRRFTPRDATY